MAQLVPVDRFYKEGDPSPIEPPSAHTAPDRTSEIAAWQTAYAAVQEAERLERVKAAGG
jgi:hypothetical protein